ncbi:DUF1707 SHOCT-like domain-containing protein [Tessaracoccus antarcticus]|uniref:DUF1707 domain-containing protein n=1 Tax=Tessaracoccus antarcticus TaxID=2479848 RepID=A0A3M0G517_9ACTN|nr:DUF1707 domain-containing protein [Tessaracoccus antarcticus]RMB59668.1 DUF1707 domain-containing protein [Tessaracoccus antarcticus]
MTNTPQSNPWQGFARDPRSPEASGLRASDFDRDHAADILAEAYADGRLRDPEYSQRLEQALQATYLRDFMPLVSDLALPTALVVPEVPRPVVPWFRTPLVRAISASAGALIAVAVLLLVLNGAGSAMVWMIWPFMFFVLPQIIGRAKRGNERFPGSGGTNELPNPNKDDDDNR